MKRKSDHRPAFVTSRDVAQAPLLMPLEAAMKPAQEPRFCGALRHARTAFDFDSKDDARSRRDQRQKIWVR